MSTLKIQGGTPQGSKSLCSTCRKAQVIRGINMQERTFCSVMERPVEFPVESCSKYDDARMPALWKMEEIAWNVESRNRGPVGYAPDGRLEIVISPPSNNNENQAPVSG